MIAWTRWNYFACMMVINQAQGLTLGFGVLINLQIIYIFNSYLVENVA